MRFSSIVIASGQTVDVIIRDEIAPLAGAVLLHGSGTSERVSLRALGASLAARGISTVVTDLERRPPTGAVGDPSAFSSDAIVNLDEGDHLAVRVRAAPSSLRPKEACSPSETRHVREFDVEVVMAPHCAGACRTRRSFASRDDGDSKPSRPVTDSFDVVIGQPDKESHMRVGPVSNRGSRDSLTLDTNWLAEPLCRTRDHLPDHTELTPRSEAPLNL